ncbi:PepSY-associated TM helix domain-containing protein [Thermithiobacillus plumbiphilus]|uniref:PepSY-associated TM helix domain-containing protein n=1 Tax=Thermithiobacillus plumbiphilus TaxID=1729899 RepID=A0ABU9D955_9PROT
MSKRQFWVKTHIYIGTLLIVPLLVIALTGILLGFYDQLRYGQAPYRLGQPAAQTLAPSQLAARVQAAYPDARLEILYLPTAPERAARAKLAGEGGSRMAFLDPATGQTLALKPAGQEDWLDFLYHLHRGKPLGLTGQIIASATGAFILLLWLVGLWLWWPRRGRPRPWGDRDARTKAISLHRWLGLWAGGLFASLAVVGALLNFAGPLIDRFDPAPKVAVGNGTSAAYPLNSLVAIARHGYPQAALERIYFAKNTDAVMRFRFRDGGWVFLDGITGEVLKRKTPTSHWTNLLFPLHSGRIFGSFGPMFMSFLALALLTMSLSGLYYWRARS